MKSLFCLALGVALSFAVGSSLSAQTTTVIGGPVSDTTATVNGGGLGNTPNSDFLGVVTSTSPLQIEGIQTQTVSSGFTSIIGDVIGRDLESTGANFTNGTITWTVNLPSLPANFVPGTFNYEASFSASLDFLGNEFSASNPNALNFALTADSVVVSQVSAQSGVAGGVFLFDSNGPGQPISTFEVTASFPNGDSFDAGTEEFRIFNDALTVDFNFQTTDTTAVPEPGSFLLIGLASLGVLSRRRR